MKKTRVKICCISSMEEAELAIEAGASALGLVGPMPSGPGIISNEKIAEIANAIVAPIDTFLLTSETTVQGIMAHYQKVKTTTIQLVDEIENDGHARLKELLPDVKIIQVIHVIDERSMEEAIKLMDNVDALLLDSGNPNLTIKELGGTGKTHNWEWSKKIVEASEVPVWLAGGLKTQNVQDAINQVQPYGLDLCSGVRTDQKLDKEKLFSFFKKVNTARN